VHRLVIQQIAKASGAVGEADMDRFVDLVSRAYDEFDRDRRRTDRSMALMIDEIDMINRNLERLVAERTQELRATESNLRTQNLRFEVALTNMTQGLILHDSSGRVIVCNQRYLEMYGLSPDVVTPGCSFHDLIAHRGETGSFTGDVDAHCLRILRKVALGEITHTLLETTDGRSIQIANRPLADGGWVSTHEDITERRRSDEQIKHLAHYDLLTDLPNRAHFRGELERALERVQRGERIAVLYIDIDEFKSVNDSLGHPVGDELLKVVADRLRGCIGKTDIVARLGGDEFAIIQTAVAGRTEVRELVKRIYETIRVPHECAGHLLTTDASIGIAMAPEDGVDLNELLKNADLAMYGAKADGRRTYRFFESCMDARVKALRALEVDMRKAIVEGGFEIHYQPVVNLRDNVITGCEALLRWRHAELGLISPAQFIPVAEDTGLINQLGEWVLNAACAEATKWPDHIKIAVNVSPIQFRSQTLALKVAAALAASGLSADRLELEITEAVLIRDDEAALAMLHELRRLGVRIALDDFGTGYSSLSYLQRFPFDKIKIDRSFIKDITDANGSSSIVQAVVDIGAARNMTTTAEGVETEDQRELLRQLDCTEMQGYLFSAAMPAAQISRLLRSGEEDPAAMPARRRRSALGD
jgi:diguanylate cyclase (GGDEF)-like protein